MCGILTYFIHHCENQGIIQYIYYSMHISLNKLQFFQQLRYLNFLNCKKEKLKCQIQFQESFFSKTDSL